VSLDRLPAVLVFLFAASAQAWPVDVYVDLEQGRETFKRLAAIEWVEVEDASVATAEVLPSRELLLTGHKPGRTLLLLYAEGKFAVWRLRIGPPGEKVQSASGERAAVEEACPGAQFGEKLVLTVGDEACRTSLARFLEGDAFSARELEITFELPALQSQLSAIQKRLEIAELAPVQLRYVGAGLVIEGALTPAEHRKVLWGLFRESVGRVPLDDQTRVRED
jgi:Pilus formation protein N terminal region